MTAVEPHTTPAAPRFSRRVKVIVSRRGRPVWVPLLVVALLALAAWPAAAAYGRSQVEVLTDVEPLTCTGTEVVVGDVGWDAPVWMPVAELEEDLVCLLRFRIENRGPVTVHLQEVRLSTLGPTNANRVEATTLTPLGTEPVPDDELTADAIFQMPQAYPIRPDEVHEFAVVLAYSPRGCMCEGCTVWFPDNPSVTVRAFGLAGEQRLLGDWFGFRGTVTSETGGGCDED